ncbi:hypothetical protein [Streptomyces sp. CS081A]|uniref:hypothetical protein n=1 Tax=Streptomyces sp. CS081A TaxID=2162709 RepID=UPI000D51A63A|nr:hypothetical protein [Streptomyces sp. CS081A]PVC73473.1 hypothetical protein DBP18_14075 [Streptomyces sp. CS081A]
MGGPLQRYRYRGTVLKLNDQDAQSLGLGEADLVGGVLRGEARPETLASPDTAQTKAVAGAANKARAASANKGGRSRRKPSAPAEGDGAGDQAGDGDTVTGGPEPADGGGSGGGGDA